MPSKKAPSIITAVDDDVDFASPTTPTRNNRKSMPIFSPMSPGGGFQVSHIFNAPARPDDYNIRSSDGYEFHISRAILTMASPSFSTATPGDDGTLAIAEPACILDVLFTLIYPVEAPTWTSLEGFSAVLDAAIKYDMRGVIDRLRRALVCPRRVNDHLVPAFVDLDPLRVFAIAKSAGLEAEAELAAHAVAAKGGSILTPGKNMSVEVENMPTKYFRELVALRESRDWKNSMLKGFKSIGAFGQNGFGGNNSSKMDITLHANDGAGGAENFGGAAGLVRRGTKRLKLMGRSNTLASMKE